MRVLCILPLALVLAAGCEADPTAVGQHASAPTVSARRTSVTPSMDGAFGPIVLASCEGGYNLLYEQRGTVTAIETVDGDGDLTRLQFVWNLTFTVSNSVTGFSLSGPSHGPDQTTFNADGTERLVQFGLVGMLPSSRGAPLTIDAGWVEFLISGDDVTLVSMAGPHPHHEGYPERPVLCALVDQ